MAGKVSGGGGGGLQPNSEPNVIPFIDIMLVMLIIFMVAAPLPTVDIKVDLPPPGRPNYVQPTDKPTVLTLQDQGGVLSVWVGDQEIHREALADELLRITLANNPSYRSNIAKLFQEAKVFVDATQETPYSNVIQLINDVDAAGFKKVSLLVKAAEPEG
ncbi:MAG: biopolymer transporter ExbD [Hyphomonadaceae bacterium]